MTYGQIKDRVLQLLNQYTVAGGKVSLAYNNQEDYVLRIPALVNNALMEASTTVRKIQAQIILSAGEESDVEPEVLGRNLRFLLPEDFYQFKTGDTMVITNEGDVFHTNVYHIQGRKYLLIPAKEFHDDRVYTITYYRYPTLIPDKPTEAQEAVALDNVPEVHQAIPYYVAAFLVIHDDGFQYSAFYNKWEDMLAKMGPDISVEMHPIEDSYCLGGWYWT